MGKDGGGAFGGDDSLGKRRYRSIQQCEDQIKEEVNQMKQQIDKMYKEQVNHPDHYNSGSIEAIEVIEDWDLGFHLGNVVKYISRAGKKDQTTEIQDLKKAAWYLNAKVKLLEKKYDEEKDN